MKEAKIWKKLREMSKKGWDGKIAEYIEYDKPGVHYFGEHVFDAGGEGFGDYYWPPDDLPKYIKAKIIHL